MSLNKIPIRLLFETYDYLLEHCGECNEEKTENVEEVSIRPGSMGDPVFPSRAKEKAPGRDAQAAKLKGWKSAAQSKSPGTSVTKGILGAGIGMGLGRLYGAVKAKQAMPGLIGNTGIDPRNPSAKKFMRMYKGAMKSKYGWKGAGIGGIAGYAGGAAKNYAKKQYAQSRIDQHMANKKKSENVEEAGPIRKKLDALDNAWRTKPNPNERNSIATGIKKLKKDAPTRYKEMRSELHGSPGSKMIPAAYAIDDAHRANRGSSFRNEIERRARLNAKKENVEEGVIGSAAKAGLGGAMIGVAVPALTGITKDKIRLLVGNRLNDYIEEHNLDPDNPAHADAIKMEKARLVGKVAARLLGTQAAIGLGLGSSFGAGAVMRK